MKLKLSFDCDNDSFGDGELLSVVAEILRNIAERVEKGDTDGACVDSNGNTVGKFELTQSLYS